METKGAQWMKSVWSDILTEQGNFYELDEKSREKIIFNIDKAKIKLIRVIKKLKDEIWSSELLFNKPLQDLLLFGKKINKNYSLVTAKIIGQIQN